MGLFKLLKGYDGKPSTTNTTDLHQQVKEARIYTPASGIQPSVGAADHQWYMDDTGTPITQITDNNNSGSAIHFTDFDGTQANGVSETIGTASVNVIDFPSTDYAQKNGISRSELFTSNTYSFSVWFKPSGTSGSVMSIGHNSGAAGGAYFHLRIGGSEATFVTYLDSGSTVSVSSTGSAITTNQWHHAACTYDSTNGAKLYINNSTPFTNASGGALNTVAPTWFMWTARNISGGDILNAKVENALWWKNAELTDADVAGLYQGGNPELQDTAAASGPSNGDVVYLNSSGEASPADASDVSKVYAIGFYEDTDDSVVAKRGSDITVGDSHYEGGTNAFAAGDTAYLSAVNAGKLVKTAPSTAGQSVVKIGKMESATKLILDIEFMYTN